MRGKEESATNTWRVEVFSTKECFYKRISTGSSVYAESSIEAKSFDEELGRKTRKNGQEVVETRGWNQEDILQPESEQARTQEEKEKQQENRMQSGEEWNRRKSKSLKRWPEEMRERWKMRKVEI